MQNLVIIRNIRERGRERGRKREREILVTLSQREMNPHYAFTFKNQQSVIDNAIKTVQGAFRH